MTFDQLVDVEDILKASRSGDPDLVRRLGAACVGHGKG